MLRVTLYLDGCEALDCMKFAPAPHVPGEVPIWTIPYCTLDSKVLVILPQFIMAQHLVWEKTLSEAREAII